MNFVWFDNLDKIYDLFFKFSHPRKSTQPQILLVLKTDVRPSEATMTRAITFSKAKYGNFQKLLKFEYLCTFR